MISLCRKDVLRNYYFIPVLFVIDLMYTVTYFVPEKIFYEVHRGIQGVYALESLYWFLSFCICGTEMTISVS